MNTQVFYIHPALGGRSSATRSRASCISWAVSTSTSYLGQVRMHDPVRVTTTCERVGTKSLTLFQQLLAGGEVRSESRSVMVVLDFARQRSEPVPDAWRERLLAD